MNWKVSVATGTKNELVIDLLTAPIHWSIAALTDRQLSADSVEKVGFGSDGKNKRRRLKSFCADFEQTDVFGRIGRKLPPIRCSDFTV